MPRVVDALRHMARAEHIGKVVIQAAPESEPAKPALALREDATYLITGGLGGLGLKLAQWLVDRGAHHLVLLGRSGASDEARRQLDALNRPGVRDRRAQVRHRQPGGDCRACLADIAGDMPPLRGIFHLAGMLDDGILREQSRERFDRVMAAKVHGAWNLHELTRDHAAGLVRPLLLGRRAVGLAGPRQLRRGQCLPGRPGPSPPRGEAAGVERQLGFVGRGGHGGAPERSRGPTLVRRRHRLDRRGPGPGHPGTIDCSKTASRRRVLPIDWPKFFARIPAGSEPAWLTEMAREARTAGRRATAVRRICWRNSDASRPPSGWKWP